MPDPTLTPDRDVAGYVHESEVEYVNLMLRLADVVNGIEDMRTEIADRYVDGDRKAMSSTVESIVWDAGVLMDTAKALQTTIAGMRIQATLAPQASPEARQRQNAAKRAKRAAAARAAVLQVA